jgi:hypothetical protein
MQGYVQQVFFGKEYVFGPVAVMSVHINDSRLLYAGKCPFCGNSNVVEVTESP